MSGKQCNGIADSGAVTKRLSKAYCEGRAAASAGLLVGDNPHPSGSGEYVSWDNGFDSWTADPATGPATGQDCCADSFGGGYVPL